MTHQGSQLSTQRAPQTSSLYLADRLKPENTGYKICIGIGAGSLTHLSSGLFIHLLIVVFLSLPAELLLSSITGFHLDFSKEPRLFWPGKNLTPPFTTKENHLWLPRFWWNWKPSWPLNLWGICCCSFP